MREILYEEYCKQVRRALKKATQKERVSLTDELMDHMESHAEALVELGWDPEEARDYAVQAMGDPETVGQQYDEQLSSFWLVCWYVLRVILIILAIWISFMFALQGRSVFYNLQARWEEDTEWVDFAQDKDVLSRQTLDIKIPLDRHTVRIFQTEIYYEETWESYVARVYVVCYPNHPFHTEGHLMMGGFRVEGFDGVGSREGSVEHLVFHGPVETGLDHVVFYIENDATDTHVQVEVPLCWEGIP